MQNAFRALNQHFQANASSRKSDVLLDLREQPIREEHVSCILNFGDHNDINVAACRFDNIYHVAIKELCADAVGAEGSYLAPKVESGKSFYYCLARGEFL